MEGAAIGPYRITAKIGEGGMGTVWIGEHTLLGRRAAIKVLLPELTSREEIVQRFFNEARAVTAISDPGIVQVFDFGHALGSAYIVMELLEGEAMDARLRRIGRFEAAHAIRLMTHVAVSLGAAHAKSVIHRDLKPENIFIVGDPAVTGGERTKILDFGIAKLAGDESSRVKTRTGMVMGTPVYMSPEQCRGASTIDARSDIYALGCVLFTMVCGRPPFESDATGDLIIMHVRDAAPAASSFAPGLPPELDALIARCLEKDPNRRFQSTAELVQGLAAIRPYPTPASHDAPTRFATRSKPTTLSAASGATVTDPAAPPKRSAGLFAGVAIAVLAIGGGVFALSSRGTDTTPGVEPAGSQSSPIVAAPLDATAVAIPQTPPLDAGAPDATAAAAEPVIPTTPPTIVVGHKHDNHKTAKPSSTKQAGPNATTSTTSTIDRGD